MNMRSLLDIKAANGWILVTSVAANLVWTLFSLMIGYYFLGDGDQDVLFLQVAILLSTFIGPFVIGWICGWLAFDDRGPTYGVVGALGSVVIILATFLAIGGVAILLSISALAGGFNGGTLSVYRIKKK